MFIDRMARRAARAALDFVYPPRCLSCSERIEVEDVLCPACLTTLVPFPLTAEQSVSHLAAMSVVSDARWMSVGYEFETGSPLAEVIHSMKYRGMHRIGKWLGRLLGERLIGTDAVAGGPLLVPVPLHRIKKLERGYNQAEMICVGIAEETGLEADAGALRRARYTRSQAACRLDRDERRSNVMNAFAADPGNGILQNRPVLVVDDLITTGATIAACASALVDAGVRDVRLLAVARPPGRVG
jgi:ComF family protein